MAHQKRILMRNFSWFCRAALRPTKTNSEKAKMHYSKIKPFLTIEEKKKVESLDISNKFEFMLSMGEIRAGFKKRI